MNSPYPPGAGLPQGVGHSPAPIPVSSAHARVPHALIRGDLSADAVLVFVQLARAQYMKGDGNFFVMPYRKVALKCGWGAAGLSDSRLQNRTCDAIGELRDAGYVETQREWLPQECRRVQLIRLTPMTHAVTRKGWEQLPTSIVDELTAPQHEGRGSDLVRAWLAWRMLLGTERSTQPTIAQAARFAGVGVNKYRALTHELIASGALYAQAQPARPTIISDLPFTVTPEPVEEVGEVREQAADKPKDQAQETSGGLTESGIRPSRNPGSRPHGIRDSYEDVLEDEKTEDLPIGPQDRVSPLSAQVTTAGQPPTTRPRTTDRPATPAHQPLRGKNDDAHAWGARHLVNAQPLLADADPRLRRQLVNLLAKRSRLAAERGEWFDWKLLTARIKARYADADRLDELVGHEADLAREAASGLRADMLVAASSVDDTGSMDLGLDRTATLLVEPPAPTGLTLEDLAALPVPQGADPEHVLEARTIVLAGRVLDALQDDPTTDVDALMAQVMYRLRGDAGYQLLVAFGTRRIRRAVEQSWIAAEHQAWLDEQTLEPDLEVQAQILASLASVQGAA